MYIKKNTYSYTKEELDIRHSNTITMLNPFGSNIETAQSLALTIESECEVVEDFCEDNDLFGDNENYDQLSDYIVEPGSKAWLTLSDGKFQHKANAIYSLLYKSTKLRTTDRL